MIIDAFTLNHELKMLGFRLEENYQNVDYFVIVESPMTFTGEKKPLFFEENKNLFEKYIDKIKHIVVNLNEHNSPIENERLQRSSIDIGLKELGLSDDDLVIISNVDEIPDLNTILGTPKTELISGMGLTQDIYYYNLENRIAETVSHSVICSYKKIVDFGNSQIVRDNWHTLRRLEKGGWHFSSFGDADFIRKKIQNSCHQQYNNEEFLNREHIEYCIENNRDYLKRGKENKIMFRIELDKNDYLPKNIQMIYGKKIERQEKIKTPIKKKSKKYEYVFCTVAIGEKYFQSAFKFAETLNTMSKNHKVLIVTDQKINKKLKNCQIKKIPKELKLFYPNGTFNYNLKYYPIKLASEGKSDIVMFFDADWIVGPGYSESKVDNFVNFFMSSNLDFIFERPHFIGAKTEWDNCFWRHKIEPYKLMETNKYDHGHVCNEQFLAFKNTSKLKVFSDAWDKRDKFSVENNIWPFAEGLEIGMSAIDAEMNFTWHGLENLNSCFMFYCASCEHPLTRF